MTLICDGGGIIIFENRIYYLISGITNGKK